MNLAVAILHNFPAFKCGEFATFKSHTKLNEVAITQMRSLLTDHHMKRLAS